MSKLMEQLADWGADVEGALERFVEDEDFYQTYLHKFVDEPGFNQLGDSIRFKEYEEAFETAHMLKGVSGNLGLSPIYDSLCLLVEQIRKKNTDSLEELYLKIMLKYTEFCDIL